VQKNIGAGLSLLDSAETGMQSQQKILESMRELAVQAANGTLNAEQRTALGETFQQFQSQLDQSANSSGMFGQNLISATSANVVIQSGINAGNTFSINAARSDGATLGVDAATININDVAGSSTSITAIDTAIDTLSQNRAILGAQHVGLSTLAKNAENVTLNLESSRSRVEDANIPEMMNTLNSLQAKNQFATAMLSMMNSSFQNSVLSLLR
jgi:flagellin